MAVWNQDSETITEAAQQATLLCIKLIADSKAINDINRILTDKLYYIVNYQKCGQFRDSWAFNKRSARRIRSRPAGYDLIPSVNYTHDYIFLQTLRDKGAHQRVVHSCTTVEQMQSCLLCGFADAYCRFLFVLYVLKHLPECLSILCITVLHSQSTSLNTSCPELLTWLNLVLMFGYPSRSQKTMNALAL